MGDLDPGLARRSEIQGPLRSVIRAVITSVPVTRIPARTFTGTAARSPVARAPRPEAPRATIAKAAGPWPRQAPSSPSSLELELAAVEPAGEAQREPRALEALLGAGRQHLAGDQRLPPAPEQADLDRGP